MNHKINMSQYVLGAEQSFGTQPDYDRIKQTITWLQTLDRIYRRIKIAQTYLTQPAPTLQTVKAVVRDQERQNLTHHVFRALISSEYVILRERYQLMADLAQAVHQKFPGISTVFLGSLANKSGLVGHLLNHRAPEDLDCAILSDRPLDRSEKKAIANYMQKWLLQHASASPYNLSFPPQLCEYYNPTEMSLENFPNVTGAKRFILQQTESLWIYFQLTFPDKTAKSNQKYILEALHEIAVEDKDDWQQIRNWLIRSWQQNMRLQEKHLLDAMLYPPHRQLINGKTRTMIADVTNNSERILAQAFREMIDSTGS